MTSLCLHLHKVRCAALFFTSISFFIKNEDTDNFAWIEGDVLIWSRDRGELVHNFQDVGQSYLLRNPIAVAWNKGLFSSQSQSQKAQSEQKFMFSTVTPYMRGTPIWVVPSEQFSNVRGRFASVMQMVDMRLPVSAKLYYPSGLRNEGEPEEEEAGRSALMDSPQDMENEAKITTDWR